MIMLTVSIIAWEKRLFYSSKRSAHEPKEQLKPEIDREIGKSDI